MACSGAVVDHHRRQRARARCDPCARPARDRKGRHPIPSEVGLVVEVAESSLETDRREKARLYARAGIPRYWIVNLVDRCLEVYEQLAEIDGVPGYRRVTSWSVGQFVELHLDDRVVTTIAVADLLP
ncbi:MAG: Uma2 family endonuclease [Myxococcota bacterium]